MKRKAFLLLFITVFSCAHSQVTLRGEVKNKQTGEPLPGAILYFPDFKAGSSTNSKGEFTFDQLPKVKTLLQVKLIGYKTQITQIDLVTTPSISIELEESVIEEEEIVVTGSSHATEIKQNPVPLVSIDPKFLEQNSSNNIIDAISKVPGVSAISTGPNISKPIIRGLGYNRVLTLFDGVRQDGQQWGDEHGIEIDQYLINRIEVIKGPASLIYGSDALAGVINLLPENSAPQGKIIGKLESNYQTNNSQLAESFHLSGHQRSVSWGFTASKKIASNFQNKIDGKVYGTKYNESDLNAHLGINRSWGFSQLNFSMYDNIQEVPDGHRDSSSRKFIKQITEADTIRPIVSDKELNSYNISGIHQRVKHLRLFSNNSFYFNRYKLDLKLGVQQSSRQEFSHPQTLDVPGLSLLLNTGTYDCKFHLPEFSKTNIVVGVNGMIQQNTNNSATEFVIPDYHLTDIGPFVLIKKKISSLNLAFGARYDNRSFSNKDLYTKTNSATGFTEITSFKAGDTTITQQFKQYQHVFNGVSGSFGATYDLSPNVSLKSNIGRGYRAPNISEISAKGIHPGTGLLQLGDGNFKPEFSLQEDVGIFIESEHISTSIELFNNTITNYIYNEKLLSKTGGDSLYIESGNVYPVFKFRQTTAQLYGGEFSIDIHPHPLDWLHIENTISYINATNKGGNGTKITDSTRYLPFIPPLHSNTELKAEFKKKKGCFNNIFIKSSIEYYAAQNNIYSAYGTETKTPSYWLLHAGLGFGIVNKKGNTLLTLIVNANNLTNNAYQNNMSRLKYFDNYPVNGTGRSGIYSMGRNISFKLLIPLTIIGRNQ